MKLELLKAHVKNVEWGGKTALKGGVLTVDKAELLKAVADENFKKVDAELARPGESIRIVPVKDAIEPRFKVEGGGQEFPGVVSDVEPVGEGKTFVLEGAAVVTCGRIVNFQEGIVDMTGPAADYTPFSKTMNVVLIFEPVDGLEKHDYEKCCRIAGLKAALYLAQKAYEAGAEVDESKTYEIPNFVESMKSYPGLPKVAYL